MHAASENVRGGERGEMHNQHFKACKVIIFAVHE